MEISKIFHQAGQFKPLYRLECALNAFKETLAEAQSKEFDRLPRSGKINSHDVAGLMAEIEHILRKKTRKKSNIRAKLLSLAMAVQKFASVGDVLVTVSGSPIVRGVWFAFRMALVAVASIETTMASLSALFMEVGKLAPAYEDLAVLYQQSQRFQDALCEYHIVVVDLCKRLVEQSKSFNLKNLLPFKDDQKYFETELNHKGLIVQHEKELLMATDIRKISSGVDKLQWSLTKKKEDNAQYRRILARQRVIDGLPNHNYKTSYQQYRKMGNTELFASDPAYLKWREEGSTLLVNGKLGSGKTVLMANIVEDLQTLDAQHGSSLTAYFFCRRDVPDSLDSDTIFGCLLKQLLISSENLDWEELSKELHFPLSTREIINLIGQISRTVKKCRLILDGVYECSLSEQKNIAKKLYNLQEYNRIAVSLSLRANDPSSPRTWLGCLEFRMPKDNPDIEQYIENELKQRLEDKRLKVGSLVLIEEICTALIDGANDMFLWVALMIDCLCLENTDRDIRESLKNLPKDLGELFEQLLRKHFQRSSQENPERVLQILVGARRLLTEDEFSEAFSIDPLSDTWDPSRRINDICRTLARCGGLIVVDDEDKTIRLAHPSVKQFLLQKSAFKGDLLNKILAGITITYLNYDNATVSVRSISLEVVQTPYQLLQDVPKAVTQSVLPSGKRNEIVNRIFQYYGAGKSRKEG